MENNNNETPYGEEWQNNMMNWDKIGLINYIRNLLIERQTTLQNIIIRPCEDCEYNDTFKEYPNEK